MSSFTNYKNRFVLKINLRDGIKAIAAPQVTSNPPTVRLYHFDGILKLKTDENGNTFAYFTYSFLWKKYKKNIIITGVVYI